MVISAKALTATAVSVNVLIPVKVVTLECPRMDDSHITISPSACNTPDGSITGITGTGTGTLIFTWYDAKKNVVGNNADLFKVPAGTYTLVFRDQSKCLPTSTTYTVPKRNNIIIDQSKLKITPAGCNAKNGSVTGLNIINGAQYRWVDAGGKQVAITTDLTSVADGNYFLIVTSADGCSTTSTFLVPSVVPFPKPVKIDSIAGACGGGGSAIKATFNLLPTDPAYTYTVYSAVTQAILTTGGLAYTDGTPVKITLPIPADGMPYSLVLSTNNCSGTVGTYVLHAPAFKIINGPFFLTRNDACGRHTGGISGIALVGGTLPYRCPPLPCNQVYIWKDSTGTVISGARYSLGGLGKGTYTLTVQDAGGCSDTRSFTIGDSTAEASPPSLSGVTLCLPGVTNLSVINPDPNLKYRLYDSTRTTLLAESGNGIFQEKVMRTKTFYATTINGLCESAQTPVTVIVIAPGVIIPNAFTPNNDGVNDLWSIPHIGDFPGAEISVFNRAGLLVYHSINYARPFDGKYNGANLPAGVYYYIIDLKSPDCFGKVSGSVTLVR